MQAMFLLKIVYRYLIFEGFYGRFPEAPILAFKNGICVSCMGQSFTCASFHLNRLNMNKASFDDRT